MPSKIVNARVDDRTYQQIVDRSKALADASNGQLLPSNAVGIRDLLRLGLARTGKATELGYDSGFTEGTINSWSAIVLLLGKIKNAFDRGISPEVIGDTIDGLK